MPLSFSDSQLRAVCAATRQLRYEARRRYLPLIADELDQCGEEIGDGNVARAVPTAVRVIRRNPAPRGDHHHSGDRRPGGARASVRDRLDTARRSGAVPATAGAQAPAVTWRIRLSARAGRLRTRQLFQGCRRGSRVSGSLSRAAVSNSRPLKPSQHRSLSWWLGVGLWQSSSSSLKTGSE